MNDNKFWILYIEIDYSLKIHFPDDDGAIKQSKFDKQFIVYVHTTRFNTAKAISLVLLCGNINQIASISVKLWSVNKTIRASSH